MRIKEILSKKGREVFTVNENAIVYEVIRLLAEKNIGCLLITDDHGSIKGIISERDIVRAAFSYQKNIKALNVEEVMTPLEKIIVVNENEDVQNAMSVMTTKKIRHLPVINDQNELCGLISIGDVVNALLNIQATQIKMLQDYISGTYPS